MEYILHLLILISFYTILAQSLNLISGYTGLISLAHAGFFGIGAYTTAIFSVNYGFSFWLNIPIAVMISGLIAFVISLISLRSISDYFVICTLGIQMVIFSLMNNLTNITNGPLGISNIPGIYIWGVDLNGKVSFLLLSIIFTASIWYILNNITKSGFGKSLTAISEDEIYIQSLGKNVYRLKIISFTISAIMASIPGVLYAHYISYIDPSSFTINESIFIISIVMLGGAKNLRGSFYAATFMILLPEALRFVIISSSIAANLRQIIYGLLLIIAITKSEGIFGEISNKLRKNLNRN